MWKKKLALGTSNSFDIDVFEQIKLIAKVGFEAIFFGWQKDLPVDEWVKAAKNEGLIVQSLHAPFKKAADFWHGDDELAKEAIDELNDCLDCCAKNNIEIMIAHAFIGFKRHEPTDIGIKRFKKVVEHAEKVGVKIAFENTEGEEYLFALMDAFKDSEYVGFCWDSGHEMCYNHSKDLLAIFGDRLIATHINDNLGIKDYSGEITYLDDLHLLPFDGIADWDYNAKRLLMANCPEILTFELSKSSKRDRFDNDIYKKMDITDYISECYKRACRVAAKLTIK